MVGKLVVTADSAGGAPSTAATPGPPAAPAGAATPAAAAASVAAAPAPAASSAPVGLSMVDIAFEPTELTIAANTDVVVNLVNNGAATHNFDIDALNIHSGDYSAGQKGTVTINAPAGTYKYYCSQPGHKEAGMVGRLIVTAESGAGKAARVTATMTPTAVPGTISLSGSGQTAVDPFELPAGLYKFAATCDDGFFFVDIKPVAGKEYVSLSLVGSGPYTGSTNVSIEGGRYATSVQCQGLWTLDITPVV